MIHSPISPHFLLSILIAKSIANFRTRLYDAEVKNDGEVESL